VNASFFDFNESKMSNERPPGPAEFRQQMVELVLTRRKPVQLSSEFGVKPQFIPNWVGKATINEAKPLQTKEGLMNLENHHPKGPSLPLRCVQIWLALQCDCAFACAVS
jgi:hypothetical protein